MMPIVARGIYHLVSQWKVDGTVKEAADVLEDVEGLASWWPSAWLEAEIEQPGDEKGVGKVARLVTRGWLPYNLHWYFRVVESDSPYGFTIQAFGDFDGIGIWTLEQAGPEVHIVYDWTIAVDKPLVRWLSPILKPIFVFNHRWAMARGLESLRLEMVRRRAKTNLEKSLLGSPPGPARYSGLILAGAALLVVGAVRLLLSSRESPCKGADQGSK